MRAVNLIPGEDRRRRGPQAGHLLLAGLALAVLATTIYVLAANRVSDREAQLARVSQQSTAADRELARLRPYQQFAELEANRVSTVRSLARSRFDWERSMRDLARVSSRDVWLTGVTGTVTPDVTVDGGSSDLGSDFRSAMPNPALELAGCATSNDALVRFLSRLRAMRGAVRVTLADATKADSASPSSPTSSPGASSAGAPTGCSSTDHWPAFHVVVFYEPPAGAILPITGASSTTSAAAPVPAPAPTPSPAPTGTVSR